MLWFFVYEKDLKMVRRYYKYTMKLNATHDTAGGKPHSHTFYIVLFIASKREDVFVEYTVIENSIQDYLERFSNILLNSAEEFWNLSPTIENMGRLFFSRIAAMIDSEEYELEKLEIGDNILKKFIVAKHVNVGNCGNIIGVTEK